MTATTIKDVTGTEVPVTIHASEEIPAGLMMWDDAGTTPHANRLVGYLKRYLRHNACRREEWHVIPFTSTKDGSKWFSLYIGYRADQGV